MIERDGVPVLTLLQGYLANAPLPPDGRLPPERDLAEALGVSRPALRKALAVLEGEGQLWRHVGKGTFLGPRPLAAIGDVAQMAAQAGPEAVMRARLVLEPALAAQAARQATGAQREDLRRLLRAARAPCLSWRGFEGQDATLHRAIAVAAGNPVLLHLFDEVSAIRRAVTWARPRARPEGPPPDHHSFAEHERIVAAILARDAAAAAAAMRAHLTTVERNLTG